MSNKQGFIEVVLNKIVHGRNASNLLFWLLILMFSSCAEESQFVVPVNPADLFGDSTQVFNAERSKQLTKSFINKLYESTVGKEFPAVSVVNIHGEEFAIDEVLPARCILITGDMHCFVGVTGMLNDFPQALTDFQHKHQLPEVICMLTRTPADLEYPDDFERSILQLQEHYTAVYVIEESEAHRINSIFPATRFYVENKLVNHIAFGISNVEIMMKELDRYAIR